MKANPMLFYWSCLSIFITLTCRTWAGDVISLKDWKAARSACASALTTSASATQARRISVLTYQWLSKIVDPKIVDKAEFEEMGRVDGSSFGLLSISTTGYTSMFFYARLGSDGNLIDHVKINWGSGSLSEGIWKNIDIEAKQTVRNLVAQKFSKAIEGSGKAILRTTYEEDPTKALRFFALSNNGKYLTEYSNNLIEVRASQSPDIFLWMPIDANGASIWVDSVSDDGTRVVVTLRDTKDSSKAVKRILNVQSGSVEFSAQEDAMGFPFIRFFDGGYTVLNPTGASIYKNGKVASVFPISNSTQFGMGGLTCINMPREGYYNPTLNEFLLFSHGPQPIKFSGSKLHIFEDARPDDAQQKAEIATDNLLDALASDKYHGMSEGNFSVSRDWRYVAQERQSGSGWDLSLQDSVALFSTNGQYLRSVSPFWSVGTISLSQDGKFLAISEQWGGPTPTMGKNKRIWIYSISNFDVPVYAISGIEVWTIDRITFGDDNRLLYVESVNSGKVLEYSLD